MSKSEKDDRAPLPRTPDSGIRSRFKKECELRSYSFNELSGGLDVVLITCGEEVYQLKQTRFGKLLLNK
jgi:hemin uptake protein HemP